MQFLLDENVPLATVLALRGAGHDVASVSELFPGAPDTTVLAFAVEESRVVVTFDRDFGALIFAEGAPPPPGVLYLRFNPANPEEPFVLLTSVISQPEVKLLGHLTVVDRERIRQRKLPTITDV